MTGGWNELIGHAVASVINEELIGHFVFITTKWKLCMHEPLCGHVKVQFRYPKKKKNT